MKWFGKAAAYAAVIVCFVAACAWRLHGDSSTLTSTRGVVTLAVLVLLAVCLIWVTNGFRGRGRGPTD